MNDMRSEQLRSLSIDRSEEAPRGGIPLLVVVIVAIIFAGLGAGVTWFLTGGGSEPETPVRTAEPARTEAQTTAATTSSPASIKIRVRPARSRTESSAITMRTGAPRRWWSVRREG